MRAAGPSCGGSTLDVVIRRGCCHGGWDGHAACLVRAPAVLALESDGDQGDAVLVGGLDQLLDQPVGQFVQRLVSELRSAKSRTRSRAGRATRVDRGVVKRS